MYVNEAIEAAISIEEGDRAVVARKLGISPGMVSHYLKRDNTPRLNIAGKLWGEYGLVIEPFTERAVIREWTRLQDDAS